VSYEERAVSFVSALRPTVTLHSLKPAMVSHFGSAARVDSTWSRLLAVSIGFRSLVKTALITPTPAVADAVFSALTPSYLTWARFMLAFTAITFILQWNFPESAGLRLLLQSGLVGCGLGVIFLLLSLAMVGVTERPLPGFRRSLPFHSRRVLPNQWVARYKRPFHQRFLCPWLAALSKTNV
jgi:hypothetical protein